MTKYSLADVDGRELIEGFNGRMIHTDNLTLAYWEIRAGAELPDHSHVHEQVVNLLEGEFELTVGGIPHRLVAGDVFVIERNRSHQGRAITDCRILDVFQPTREDYR